VIPFVYAGPLETERLLLRLFTDDDVDAVHEYQSDPEVTRFELYEPRDRETIEAKIAKWQTATRLESDGDYLQLALTDRANGQVMGDMYFTIKSVVNQTVEIGWALNPRFQGRGFATEAARALLSLAFHTLDAHRAIAELDPRNSASVRLCERLGMRLEAHFVEDLWFKGEWGDTGFYGILAREFHDGGTV